MTTIVDNFESLNLGSTSPFVIVVLIIGLLFFAKNAPKFIYDALGIKPPDRSIFAGVGNLVAAGAVAGGAVGGAIGLGYANFKRPLDRTNLGTTALSIARNAGGALFGGLSGAVGGLVTGGYAAATAKDHAAKAALDARNKYMTNSLTGNNLGHRASRLGQNLLLGYDIDRELSRNQAIETTAKDLREYAASEGAKVFSDVSQDIGIKRADGTPLSFNQSMDQLNQALASGATTGIYTLTDINGNTQQLSKSEMDKLIGDATDGMGNMLMDVVDGTDRGAAANYNYADANRAYTEKVNKTKRNTHTANVNSKRSSYGGAARLSNTQAAHERASAIKGRQYGASNEAARLKAIKGSKQ